ncbi:MAG: cellulase family glycosylhydrolase [Candidatus Micrarchaeota archaeon]|nr:cellulase family glycosylhydrolase [Candidatus Micrarchaeota archaeon]
MAFQTERAKAQPADPERRRFIKFVALGAMAGLGAYALGSIPGLSSALRRSGESLVESQGICLHDLDAGEEGKLVPAAAWLRSDVGSDGWAAISDYASGTGRKTLAILGQFALWSAGLRADSFSREDWRAAVLAAVKANPSSAAFEIWNEPLQNISGYQDGTPERYMEMLMDAHDIIRDNAPASLVVAGGGLQVYGPYADASLAFAKSLAELGAWEYCNAVSLHAYPYGEASAGMAETYERNVRAYADTTGREIWISETGQVSQYDQQAYMETAYPALLRGGASKIFWYELVDDTSGDFGLLTSSMEKKRAYDAYTRELGDLESLLR